MKVPVQVTCSNGEQTLVLDGTFAVNEDERVPDEGGHGEFRTYLMTYDDETAIAYCLTCVAEDMVAGRISKIEVSR